MKFTQVFYPLLVVLLTVFAVAPLEYPGAFQSHTGLSAYYNLIDLDQNPALGWSPTIGQSFDLFRTDGALPYLIAEIFHLIGFAFLDAIKLVYALAWIASGLTMFALAQKYFSGNGALLAAMVYMYLPFHIATVYVRGAFAESVAWALFPLGLLAVVSRQSMVDGKLRFTFCALPFILLFLTQPGIAILFSLVAFAIAIVSNDSPYALRHTPCAICGLFIGAFLYLPTILRYGTTIIPDGFNANFVYPFQLFSSLWGTGISTGSYLDKFPFQLGVVPIGLAIVLVALIGQRRGDPAWSPSAARIIFVFLGTAIVLSILTFEIIAPLWNVLGIFVAYPWQILAFVGLLLAFVAGAVTELDERLARPGMLAFFVALPVVASYGYLAPRYVDVNPSRPPVAIFGDNEIALWDYRIVGPLRHGATVRVQLAWQALRPVDHDYTIFVHAVHENGNTYAQDDSKPQDGSLPTIKWTPGEIIADTHTIQIDVDGPSEGFHLELGMYVGATGKRALTATGADQLILPRPGDPEPTITDQLPPKPR